MATISSRVTGFFKRQRDRLLKLFTRRPRESREHICIDEPIRIGDENLYMYFANKSKIKIPLFNIFNFQPQRSGIQNKDFFSEFYDTLLYDLKIWNGHTFYITKNNDVIEIYEKSQLYNRYKDARTPEYNSIVENFFIPYLLYIFANNKIILEPNIVFKADIDNPENFFDPTSGIHKDNNLHSCLTYIDSPLSTELAFDLKELQKETDISWMSCSPIFRFDTQEKLYTLCFNDIFMLHTIPIWEKEGISPSELQSFEQGYTVTERDDGKIVHGNPELHVFMKPEHREKVPPPRNRKIIACFIENSDDDSFTDSIKYERPFSILDQYKISYSEESIELFQDAVTDILTKKSLSKVGLRGGKSHKKRHKKKRTFKRRGGRRTLGSAVSTGNLG